MTLLTDALPVDALPVDALPVDALPVDLVGLVDSDVADPLALTVPVRGAFDAASLARVREELDLAVARRPCRLVVDLTDCPFVDASALAVLLETHRRMARAGRVLTLRGCSPRVLRLLSLTGLRRVFDLG